jgi:hypothetical protein
MEEAMTDRKSNRPPAREYFRCPRLSATLSRRQCVTNRRHAANLDLVLASETAQEDGALLCLDCPLAPKVDAGKVPFFTAPEVYAGKALPAPDPRARLPWERRDSARPSDRLAFTSAFWVPELDA